MLPGIAVSILLFLLQAVLAVPTPTPLDTPTKTMTTRAYKTSKNKGYTVKLSRKGSIILGAVIGGFFGTCLLCIALTVLKRTIQERRQAKRLERREKIEHEQPSEDAQATASKYPGLFETPQPKLDGQPGNYTPNPAHSEDAPPYQATDGSIGFESSPNAATAAVVNESWKQGTVVETFTPGTEPKEQLDLAARNSRDEKAPFKLF